MHNIHTYNNRIENHGHRHYVGGGECDNWHNIGKMQYHYLVANGLQPKHVFLDLACGCLRLGQWLIPMLDKGNYYGLDGSEKLVKLGIEQEMLYNICNVKKPVFSFNYDFNLDFIESFDFAMAHSLFTHLTEHDIQTCLTNVKAKMHTTSKFYFTILEGDKSNNPVHGSHPNIPWEWDYKTLHDLSIDIGLSIKYIGDWNHPKNQKLLCASLIQ